ncbi:MAG: hypothetical protein HC792_01830 [Acaryochloridaceae cyanobacterium CSU_5_19]|nr:hypothetical protein [Acaryochloridaceae cyanobacterium CSU_5_19]
MQTQLEVGNTGRDFFTDALNRNGVQQNPVFPGSLTDAAGNTGRSLVDTGAADYAGVSQNVRLRRLAYSFKPFKDATFTVGTNVFPSDFVDFNSYANNSAQDFSSGFFINNPLIINNAVDIDGGAGVALDWNPNEGPFSVRATYVASQAFNATGIGGGLGGAPHTGILELEYANTFGADEENNFAIRLQGAYSEADAIVSPATVPAANSFNIEQKVLGVNAEATFGKIGIFGRYGISFNPQVTVGGPGGGTADLLGPAPSVAAALGVNTGSNIQTWMGGVGVKDILVPGSLFAVAVGQPYIVSDGLPNQFNLEAFYR